MEQDPKDWIDAAERSIGEVIGDQDIDLLQAVCRLRTERKVLPRRLTLSLGQANQLDAPSSRERSGAYHIGCLTGLLNRDPRPVVFVKALQRIADLLDKDRRISQFFAEYFAHGEKLSRISPRSLRALPQCRGQGIEHRHFLA